MATIIERKNSSASENRKLDTSLLSDRDTSFHTNSVRWPASLPTSDAMAEAGFYFTPTDKYSDCASCFRCGIKMFNWLPDDTPKVEHKKLSPSCKEVKTWSNVIVEDDRRVINRADQTDSNSLRSRIAGKAKKFTGSLHRKHEKAESLPSSISKEGDQNSNRLLNDEEKLANTRRQREVAEKALDGLQKLSSFYPSGSTEQKRAEQSIVLQTLDLERLKEEEQRLSSSMGNLSFGRGWNDHSNDQQSSQPSNAYASDEESPEVSRGRSATRPLPVLPSQLRKNSLPRMPARIQRTPITDVQYTVDPIESQTAELPTYDDYQSSSQSKQPEESEWVEYFTEAGVPYYYSTVTKTTVWQVPDLHPVA